MMLMGNVVCFFYLVLVLVLMYIIGFLIFHHFHGAQVLCIKLLLELEILCKAQRIVAFDLCRIVRVPI